MGPSAPAVLGGPVVLLKVSFFVVSGFLQWGQGRHRRCLGYGMAQIMVGGLLGLERNAWLLPGPQVWLPKLPWCHSGTYLSLHYGC